MKVKNISYPTEWQENPSIANQKMEVLVELENDYVYSLIVATRKNIEYVMDQEKKNYFGPASPFVMVKKFTKEIIAETVQAYAEQEDGYWLKSHHFAGEIETTIFDQLQAEEIEDTKETYKLAGYANFDNIDYFARFDDIIEFDD